jgi:hypothetical protein
VRSSTRSASAIVKSVLNIMYKTIALAVAMLYPLRWL